MVTVDFRHCDSQQLSELYQAFGVLCANQQVSRALLKAGDEEADYHFALRDTLVTLARIAEIPLQFRLALLADSDAIARVYGMAQQELRQFGCDACVFRIECEACRWLRCAQPPAQP